jgi:hypothetical protein
MRTACSGVAVAAACAVAVATAVVTPEQRYVRSWATAYRSFADVYVRAYRPCLQGATANCGQAQDRAAAAALKTATALSASEPPAGLAHDAARLARDLRSAQRTLSASAAAAKAGRTSARRWCSAEQGPCTIVMIDMGNVISDINFVANVNLPLPG